MYKFDHFFEKKLITYENNSLRKVNLYMISVIEATHANISFQSDAKQYMFWYV